MGQMNVCSVKFVNTYPQNVDKYLKSVENFKKDIKQHFVSLHLS